MKINELNQKTIMIIDHMHINLFTNCIILTFTGRGIFLHSVILTLNCSEKLLSSRWFQPMLFLKLVLQTSTTCSPTVLLKMDFY